MLLRHLVNLRSANVGNGALTDGVESLVSEDLGRPITWVREAWDDYTFGLKAFDGDFVRLVNESDGMIVGGAVALNGRAHFRKAGMRLDLSREQWDEVERPVIFYGISYRHWEGVPYHHADRLKATIAHLLDRPSVLFGVRNDGTREWLQGTLGLADARIRVVPDPGVFARADRNVVCPEFPEGRVNIILALNDEDREQRYGTPETRSRVISEIARAIERLLTKWDANLIVVPHYFDDFRMVADFIDASRPQLAHQRMGATGLAGLDGSRQFYGRYLRADLAVSMRVHSMSPCIGLGVPMVPLVTQARMTDFLADCRLGDLAVDALAPDLSDRLFEAADRTLSRPETVRERFARARAALRERACAFNAEVSRVIVQ